MTYQELERNNTIGMNDKLKIQYLFEKFLSDNISKIKWIDLVLCHDLSESFVMNNCNDVKIRFYVHFIMIAKGQCSGPFIESAIEAGRQCKNVPIFTKDLYVDCSGFPHYIPNKYMVSPKIAATGDSSYDTGLSLLGFLMGRVPHDVTDFYNLYDHINRSTDKYIDSIYKHRKFINTGKVDSDSENEDKDEDKDRDNDNKTTALNPSRLNTHKKVKKWKTFASNLFTLRQKEKATKHLEILIDVLFWFNVTTRNELSEHFMEKYHKSIIWEHVSVLPTYSESFVENFKYHMCWHDITNKIGQCSKSFIDKFIDRFGWTTIVSSPTAAKSFINH